MDTIIVNNHAYPIIPDSIAVKADYSLLVDRLDSLVSQNRENFTELQNVISQEKDSYFDYISNDALFTTIITIVVFSLGLLANFIKKKIDEYRSKLKTEKFLKYHLSMILKIHIPHILNEYKRQEKKINVDDEIGIKPPELVGNDFQRILNIDSVKLFHSFGKVKELTTIINTIEYINELIKWTNSNHSDIAKSINKLREETSISKREFLVLIHNFIANIDFKTLTEDQLQGIDKIHKIIDQYAETKEDFNEFSKFNSILFLPIRDVIKEKKIYEINRYSEDAYRMSYDLSLLLRHLNQKVVNFQITYSSLVKKIKKSEAAINNFMQIANWEIEPSFNSIKQNSEGTTN